MNLGAQEQALGFYRDALEVTADPLERAALLERAGQAASATGLHEDAELRLTEAIDLLRASGDRSGEARVMAILGDAMFGRYRLDAALALLEPAAAAFADLGDDPGLATLLGQLARFQMLRQVDFGVAISSADRALEIAERLDRVDLVADVLVTRGVALVSLGRAYEGIGCLETGLGLARGHGLLSTEIRARTNMGGPLTDRDPRAAFEVSRIGLEQAKRYGHRQGVSMLIGNSSVGAIETGAWGWARSELTAGLEQTGSEEERVTLLTFLSQVLVESGEDATSELDQVETWLVRHAPDEPHLESAVATTHAARAVQRGDFAAAASGFLEAGRLDPYNAVSNAADATVLALLAGDRGLAGACRDALRETGSHAAIARLTLHVAEAGIDALDGRPDAARGPLLAAFAELGELGAARRQAVIGVVMATVLGGDDPHVRAAIDESRRLLEGMGAGLWLARLDAAMAARSGTPPGRATVPAPAGTETIGDAIPR